MTVMTTSMSAQSVVTETVVEMGPATETAIANAAAAVESVDVTVMAISI